MHDTSYFIVYRILENYEYNNIGGLETYALRSYATAVTASCPVLALYNCSSTCDCRTLAQVEKLPDFYPIEIYARNNQLASNLLCTV